MALIQCPECKKEISSEAKCCIHCGYPLEDSVKKSTTIKETKTDSSTQNQSFHDTSKKKPPVKPLKYDASKKPYVSPYRQNPSSQSNGDCSTEDNTLPLKKPRNGLLVLAIISYCLSALGVLSGITKLNDLTIVPSFLIIGIMFSILAYTKKGSKKLFGCFKDIPKVPFVVICCAVSVTLIGLLGSLCDHDLLETTRNPATCTDKGHIEYECSKCGYSTSEEIETTDHSWVEVNRIPPTRNEKGLLNERCSVCGIEQTTEISEITDCSPVYFITIEQFTQEIDSNIDEAKSKYNSQCIQITGKITHISESAGMTGYYIYGDHISTGYNGLQVICWVYGSHTRLSVGETATFIGFVREVTTFNATEIGDCIILDS